MKRQVARNATELSEPPPDLDRDASKVIDAAVEVHKILGPGFLESVYERALCVELGSATCAIDVRFPSLSGTKAITSARVVSTSLSPIASLWS